MCKSHFHIGIIRAMVSPLLPPPLWRSGGPFLEPGCSSTHRVACLLLCVLLGCRDGKENHPHLLSAFSPCLLKQEPSVWSWADWGGNRALLKCLSHTHTPYLSSSRILFPSAFLPFLKIPLGFHFVSTVDRYLNVECFIPQNLTKDFYKM